MEPPKKSLKRTHLQRQENITDIFLQTQNIKTISSLHEYLTQKQFPLQINPPMAQDLQITPQEFQSFLTFLHHTIIIQFSENNNNNNILKQKKRKKDQMEIEKEEKINQKEDKITDLINEESSNRVTQDLSEVIRINIENLKSIVEHNFVHSLGTQGGQLKNFNLSRKKLLDLNFEILHYIIGTFNLNILFTNFIILVNNNNYGDKNTYLQVSGPALSDYFPEKYYLLAKRAQKPKQNDRKNQLDISHMLLDRKKLYYCNVTGRKPGIFKKSIFNPQSLEDPQVLAYQHKKNFFNEEIVNQSLRDPLQQYLGNIIKNFRKLNISIMLSATCPLPKCFKKLKFQTKNYSIDHYSNKIEYQKEGEELFKSMHESVSTFDEIILFLKHVLTRVIPGDLFGSQNFSVLISSIEQYIKKKKFENLQIKDIICKMDVFTVPWLKKQKYNYKYQYIIIQRYRKILADIVLFLFNFLICPLIRYNFYVTEKHKEANKIFYYRKPLWNLITKLAIKYLIQENLKEISYKQYENLCIDKYAPLAKLRILPKKQSFRPIMTFNKKVNLGNNFTQNINQILGDVQLVLRNLKQILGENTEEGYSVFDNHQVFKKFEQFTKKWKKIGKPELYVVQLDIQKCYDSIDQIKLLEMFKETDILQETYIINKYLLLSRNKRPLKNTASQSQKKDINYYYNIRERTCAIGIDKDQNQIEKGGYNERQKDNRPSIIINSAQQKVITKDTIYQMLKHVCEQHVIEFGNQYFVQKYGIPQGLNVSSVLCSFYFSRLEKQLSLNKTKTDDNNNNKDDEDEASLLMRLTDDYIFLTSDKDQADRLIQELFKISLENRFQFNLGKMDTNFDVKLDKQYFQSKLITDEKYLEATIKNSCTWIGKNIQLNDLQIIPAFENDKDKNSFSMNVNIPQGNQKIGYLMNKLKSLLMNQFQDYFNPAINSEETLIRNIQIFAQTGIQKFSPFLQKFKKEQPAPSWLVHKMIKKVKNTRKLLKSKAFKFKQTEQKKLNSVIKMDQKQRKRYILKEKEYKFQQKIATIIIKTTEEFTRYITYLLRDYRNQQELDEILYQKYYAIALYAFYHHFQQINSYKIVQKRIEKFIQDYLRQDFTFLYQLHTDFQNFYDQKKEEEHTDQLNQIMKTKINPLFAQENEDSLMQIEEMNTQYFKQITAVGDHQNQNQTQTQNLNCSSQDNQFFKNFQNNSENSQIQQQKILTQSQIQFIPNYINDENTKQQQYQQKYQYQQQLSQGVSSESQY